MLRDKMRWTAYSDLLEDEYRQCLQEGLQVEPLLEEIRRIQTLSDGSLREEEARSLLARLEVAPVRSDFPYEEPEDYESIRRQRQMCIRDRPIRSGRWMPTISPTASPAPGMAERSAVSWVFPLKAGPDQRSQVI